MDAHLVGGHESLDSSRMRQDWLPATTMNETPCMAGTGDLYSHQSDHLAP